MCFKWTSLNSSGHRDTIHVKWKFSPQQLSKMQPTQNLKWKVSSQRVGRSYQILKFTSMLTETLSLSSASLNARWWWKREREIERSNTTFSIPVHTTLLLSIKTIRGTGFETSTKKERKNKVWEIESKEPRMDEENVYTWGKMSKWIETFIKYL